MAQDSELATFRAWCVYAGHYATVETLDRWLKMTPEQRAQVMAKIARDLKRRKK